MCYRLLALLLAALAGPAAAVTIDSVPIGNAGNAVDTPSTHCRSAGCGSAPHAYSISKYEVTNAQYAALVNAKEASDPFCRVGSC
jgi:formylglycine-generating enzyme required for sulfatase activity